MHLPSDFEVVTLRPGEGVNLGLGELLKFGGHLRPTKLYVLPEGASNDTPSYVWHLVDGSGKVFYAQITHDMLHEGMNRATKILEKKKHPEGVEASP